MCIRSPPRSFSLSSPRLRARTLSRYAPAHMPPQIDLSLTSQLGLPQRPRASWQQRERRRGPKPRRVARRTSTTTPPRPAKQAGHADGADAPQLPPRRRATNSVSELPGATAAAAARGLPGHAPTTRHAAAALAPSMSGYHTQRIITAFAPADTKSRLSTSDTRVIIKCETPPACTPTPAPSASIGTFSLNKKKEAHTVCFYLLTVRCYWCLDILCAPHMD